MKPKTVWVAKYSHKYDDDVAIFATEEGAERWRQALAQEWWDHEMENAMPEAETPKVIADLYFDAMADREKEWFSVCECQIRTS